MPGEQAAPCCRAESDMLKRPSHRSLSRKAQDNVLPSSPTSSSHISHLNIRPVAIAAVFP